MNELQNRIIRHESRQRYFDENIHSELINLIAKEAEKVLLTQFKQAKYFAVILDCTPDISHPEQLTATLRFVQCDDESDAKVKKTFWDYLRVNYSTGKRSLNVFLKRSKN